MALLSVLVMFVIHSWVVRPLKQLEDRMKRMAEGDLEQVLTIRTRDEFGRLSGHFHEMTGHLRAMFQSVSNIAGTVGSTSRQLTELIEEVKQGTAHAARQMTVGAEEVRKGVDTVSQSGELFASIYTEIEQVQEQITEVSAASEQMSVSSQQVAATVEQLSQIVSEAMDNASGVAAASEEQLASMEEISSSSETLSRMVRELLNKLSKFKI